MPEKHPPAGARIGCIIIMESDPKVKTPCPAKNRGRFVGFVHFQGLSPQKRKEPKFSALLQFGAGDGT